MASLTGIEALQFVAEFGEFSADPLFENVRKSLFTQLSNELRTITKWPWCDPETMTCPFSLLKAIKSPGQVKANVPRSMFDWLWPFLREHIMEYWMPSIAITIHHVMNSSSEALTHWNILLGAASETTTLTEIIRENISYGREPARNLSFAEWNRSVRKLLRWQSYKNDGTRKPNAIQENIGFDPFLPLNKSND
jgi:hypothetical protein